ncbi:MAG: DNA integrity scanning protein DisA [Actinomycetia bacterium]|nr:DNA integrity scanning protein DisA [Actinomycetes bacterium]MCP4226939.1 DNA integrity scanning protein DisA [Actinomycetes bacterium]MCP5030864.1 DNA integrity scanning protein DisA [Actinomycetes bacterium]
MQPMESRPEGTLLRALAQVAPGSPLRVGLDRILLSGRGALIVIGDGADVLNICSGGFLLDAAFTPQRLSELAKMDGAIILASDASRIARANVHLVPNPNVQTSETGTRHRTAERVARSLHIPTVAVSESRKEIQVYLGDHMHPLSSPSRLLERSNQAIQTLERYRARLDAVSQNLSALEVEDLVTLRDVVEVLQRTEMVVRISAEIERNLVELGSDGRLVRLQMEELMVGVDDDRQLLIMDYVKQDERFDIGEAMNALSNLDDEALFDDLVLAEVLRLGGPGSDLDVNVEPRGYRLLSKLPRVNDSVVSSVIDRFGTLSRVLRATTNELEAVDGVGPRWAQALKEGAGRLAESSILDRI